MLEKFYNTYLLRYPKLFLSLIIVCMSFMALNTTKLEIDASAQTLLLEGDKDLAFMRKIGKNFTANDVLVVTYTIEDDLLNDTNLDNINKISQELEKLPNIQSITSILNVPLLQ